MSEKDFVDVVLENDVAGALFSKARDIPILALREQRIHQRRPEVEFHDPFSV